MNEVIQAPSDWPKEWPELRAIDELLRCGICYDYINVAMVTVCSHNYCSLCVRKYMSYKAECPTCLTNTSEPELRNNRVLDELVQSFSSVRDKLLNLLKSVAQNQSLDAVNKKRERCDSGSEFPINFKKQKGFSGISIGDAKTSVNHPANNLSMIESKNSFIDGAKHLFNNDSKSSKVSDVKMSVKESDMCKVACPVCSVEISSNNINRHLDLCLGKSEKRTTKIKPKRTFLPKLVYHLLSEKELRNKLKAHGLSMLGEKQVLIKRHHTFTLLYNAECDSLNPRSESEIAQQVAKIEKDEKWNGRNSLIQGKLNYMTRKADPQTVEREQKKYLSKHKSQYDDLIKNIRQRSENKKQSPSKTERIEVIEETDSENDFEESRRTLSRDHSILTDDITIDSISETDLDTSDDDESNSNRISTQPGPSGVQVLTVSPSITNCRGKYVVDSKERSPHKIMDSQDPNDFLADDGCDSDDSQSLLQ